ncbi:Vacuolar inheritance and morphology protein [Dipsacomyces acuminosporus]|nr:Vacuolar inheritance and morphology protein [Dipsacomyces acuminosporus]
MESHNEEGDRQLSVETSKTSKATKRSGRLGNSRSMQGRGNRLFARGNNASSRGSEEEGSDENEQFIYRNSRSSVHVSSIPEEALEDREPIMAKRRHNRHRLSTHMNSDRRNSSGVGNRAGSAGGSMQPSAGYFPAYMSTITTPGNSSTGPAVGGPPPSAAGTSRRAGRVFRSSNNASGSTSNYNSTGAVGHRFSILTQSNNEYGESSEESDLDAEPAGLRSTYNPYARRNSRRFHSNVYYGSSEDLPESTPLFRRHTSQRRKQARSLAQLVQAILLSLLALGSMFILFALFNLTSAPLADVEAIKVSNILATEKELLFILHIQANNPNIREVLVERAEIGVFAAAAVSNSTAAGLSGLHATNETEPAILLGNVYELSDPMRFAPGSFRHPAMDIKTTQISIHHPGASIGNGDSDDEDSDAAKWKRLLKGPYDLTIRGTLQYTLWQRNYASRICISKLANVPADNSTASFAYIAPAGLGCNEGDDDTITLPKPPQPPFERVKRAPKAHSSSANDEMDENEATDSNDESEEQRRRRKFLERNRIAASKCRQKKKLWIQELERRAEDVTMQNRTLHLTVAQLKEEVIILKNQLLAHRNCGCTAIHQFLQADCAGDSVAQAATAAAAVAAVTGFPLATQPQRPQQSLNQPQQPPAQAPALLIQQHPLPHMAAPRRRS